MQGRQTVGYLLGVCRVDSEVLTGSMQGRQTVRYLLGVCRVDRQWGTYWVCAG